MPQPHIFFKKPSKIWLLPIILSTIITLYFTIIGTIELFSASDPTWEQKAPLMISITLLFVSAYGVFLFTFYTWAAGAKNKLMLLIQGYPNVISLKYDRYVLVESVLEQAGTKLSTFKNLRHKDLEEVKNSKQLSSNL